MCAYCDGDWVGNMGAYKSTLGYVFSLGGISMVKYASQRPLLLFWKVLIMMRSQAL
jgi:hypothetical protein